MGSAMKWEVEYRQVGHTAWEPLKDFISIHGTPRTLDMSTPVMTTKFHNRNGRYSTKFGRSDEFRLWRNGKFVFWGKLIDDTRETDSQTIEVNLQSIWYARLRETICMDAYLQLGYTAWKWGAASQNPMGNLQYNQDGPGAIRPDQMMVAAIGTHCCIQSFFESPALFFQFTNVTVEQQSAKLAKTPSGTIEVYQPTGTFITGRLTNSLTGFSEMKTVRDVTITIAGDQPAGTTILISLSRDDGATYVQKIPTYDPTHGKWVAVINEADWTASATKNRMRLKVQMNASGDQLAAPVLRSFLIDAITKGDDGSGDTGLYEGIIDSYDDPDLDDDTVGGDFSRQTRLDVCEAAIKGSLSPPGHDYPTWLGYIDVDGKLYFRNPDLFGRDLSETVILSRDVNPATLTHLKATRDGKVINNLIYIGQGLPPFGEITITSNEFAGLKNAASIAKYGEIQGTIQEKGVPSIGFALKRARVLSKHLADPVLIIEATPVPEFQDRFEVGDAVTVRDIRYGIDQVVIVVAIEYDYTPDGGEQVTLILSNKKFTTKTYMQMAAKQQQDQNLIGQGSSSPPALSFQDDIDATHPAEMAFWLPRGSRIRGVHCYSRSDKFRATVQAAPAASQTINRNVAPTAPYYDYHRHVETGGTTNDVKEDLIGGQSPSFVYNLAVVGGATGGTYSIVYGMGNGSNVTKTMQLELRKGSPTGTVLATGLSTSLASGQQHVDAIAVPKGTGASQLAAGDLVYVCCISNNFETPDSLIFDVTSNEPHVHPNQYGIFEFDYFPSGVQMYIKDYPSAGDNPDRAHLTVPFSGFGQRGTEAAAFEVEDVDISRAFTDAVGNFKTGQLQKVWFAASASTNNPSGLGRLIANIFVELVQGVQPVVFQ